MVQVTKQYEGKINSVSVSPDGSLVYVSIRWTDPKAAPSADGRPTTIEAVSNVVIKSGKLSLANDVIADAPANVTAAATTLASLVVPLVEGLMTSGKISP